MKKVGFIGAYDKANLILCLAKIIAMKNKRVLVIDTTTEQKFRYIVPTIHPTVNYITTWENIDVAVGFENMEQICEYIGMPEIEKEYDVILIDFDNHEKMKVMKAEENDANCFVVARDLYSIRKGIEIFSYIPDPMKLVKIVFSREMTEADNEYIDYLAKDAKMEWDDKQVIFPLILEDKYVEMDSQFIYRIGIRTMSSLYKDSLAVLIEMLFGDEIKEQDAKRIIKTLEKDGI